MSNSLNLTASLAQDRHAERYRSARSGSHQRGLVIPRKQTLETTRRRAGWLLVDLGLRLISSGPHRGDVAARRARLMGQ